MSAQVQSRIRLQRPPWTLLVLVVLFRLGTLLLLRPGGFVYDFSDYGWYRQMAQYSNEGFYPFIHYWMEYPPPFPWLNVLVYRLSLWLPPALDARLWHHWLLGLALLPFDIGILALLHTLARALHGRGFALWVASVYALLFIPLYTWAGWFDSMAVFMLLLAVWLILAERPAWAGFALGVGFLVKVSPILPIVVAVQRFRQPEQGWRGWVSRANVRLVLALAASLAALSLPWLWLNADMFLATFRSLTGRSSWETIWALLSGYFGYGVVSPERFTPAPPQAIHPERVPGVLILFITALFGFWLWTRPLDWKQPRVQIGFHALTLSMFLLASPGWSPQFLTWVLPWVLLVMPLAPSPHQRLTPAWHAVGLALLLSVVNTLEWLYFPLWSAYPLVLALIVIIRTAGLAWLAWHAWRLCRETTRSSVA